MPVKERASGGQSDELSARFAQVGGGRDDDDNNK